MNTADVQRGLKILGLYEEFPLIPPLARLLAAGQPVPVERLAEAAGWTVEDVQRGLRHHPAVERDDEGRLLGFGLTLRPTPHRFTAPGGTTLYGWCASDALMAPVLLGQAGVVESTCPATEAPIRVEVTPEAVLRVEPPGAVVSEVSPEHKVADVRASICSLGHIFRSREAAAPWLAAYPEGQLNSVADDFALHRRILAELGWAAGQGGPR
jgi:alkylmercury lyase